MSGAHWQEPNLARAPFVNERPVRRLGVALWVLFAIVGGAAVWMSQTIRRETGTRVAELARLNSETVSSRERAVALEAQLRRANLPSQNERAEFLNRRLAERTFSWNNLLETLAGVMPRGVRLIGLSPQGFARERGKAVDNLETSATTRVAMRITGEAEETEALLEFVDRLFAHPAFDRPNLSRESTKKDDKLQFDLTVDYLPQVAAPPGLLAATDAAGEGRSAAPAAGQASAGSMAATAATAAGAATAAATAGTAGAEGGVAAGDGRRIQGGAAAGAQSPSGSARRPAERVGRAAPDAAATPDFGGSADDAAAAVPAPGGRVRPGSPGALGVPPGTPGGTRFPATVLPTPLRPYASGIGGGQ